MNETVSNWIRTFMSRVELPQEAFVYFDALLTRIFSDEKVSYIYNELYERYFVYENADIAHLDNDVLPVAAIVDVPARSIAFLLLMQASMIIKRAFCEKCIDDDLFWDSMRDFKSKLIECRQVKGEWGSFVEGWLWDWKKVERLTLGRFTYSKKKLEEDYILPDRRVVPAGHLKLECHIPSNMGPLTDEVRYDSYKRAWGHFKDVLQDGLLIISCSSWLLYPRHKEFLPAGSNILRFMDDFDIIGGIEQEEFKDAWRIFGSEWGQPLEQLPEDTSLRKVYKEWLLGNRRAGRGYGILVIDENGIANKNGGQM